MKLCANLCVENKVVGLMLLPGKRICLSISHMKTWVCPVWKVPKGNVSDWGCICTSQPGKCLLHEWKPNMNYKFNACFMLNVQRLFRSFSLVLTAARHFLPVRSFSFSTNMTFSYCYGYCQSDEDNNGQELPANRVCTNFSGYLLKCISLTLLSQTSFDLLDLFLPKYKYMWYKVELIISLCQSCVANVNTSNTWCFWLSTKLRSFHYIFARKKNVE